MAQLRSQGFVHTYNLDYQEAVASFDKALALDPNDSATHRARATAIWLHIIFRRGSITVDQYHRRRLARRHQAGKTAGGRCRARSSGT